MNTLIAIPIMALAAGAAAISVSTTPHDSYSSSVGVLGCKIDTNRVAYWPQSVDCTNICVKLTYGDRSVNLLRIDQSGGAYDISYDAWAYLQTGESATVDPLTGGGVEMEYEDVDASECADLIFTEGSKLPLSASNSMNFVSSCLADSSSWVANNYVLYNICDAICSLGYDETCTLDLSVSNQPSCSHTLGLTTSLTSTPVYNIEYETGKVVNAGTGAVDSTYSYAEAGGSGSEGTEATTQAATTAAAATSSSAAVFVQLATSSTSVAEYSAAALSTSTSSYAVATPSTSESTSATAAGSVTQTYAASGSASSSAAASSTISYASYSATGSGFASASASAAQTASTLLVVTVSSSQSSASTATSSAAAATTTAKTATGGNSKLSVPVLALISSITMCLVASAL
ncbi:hypothetical protein BX600DRAFT_462023 [Xylariales sp. PMI_506]|nr:hypothetical protein BX600DRAFT_462023 [Xylariales sp. PMI_506]